LQAGKVAEFGTLMDQSHSSLRDNYEVSCQELDTMVRLASEAPGCLGARMTGAGFGGCTVNLVHAQAAEAFALRVSERYARTTGRTPTVYICEASAGAGEI
jgi:galactokinase